MRLSMLILFDCPTNLFFQMNILSIFNDSTRSSDYLIILYGHRLLSKLY